LFNFFKKNNTAAPLGYRDLKTDMHSHLLPGIDDGAPTLEESLSLIRQLKALGYQKLVTTPHIYTEFYPNTSAIIQEKLALVRQACAAEGIDITIDAAAEYFMDDHFAQLLEKGDLLPLWDNLVLVEMSFMGAPPQLEQYLFRLQTKGFVPVLAHPERYGFMHHDLRQYERLKDLGCKFQLNLLSLTGYYEKNVVQTAEKLLHKGWIDFLGTDLHHQRHMDHLKAGEQSKAMRQAIKMVTGG
jgi:tyrosine-protein phosphatase YwqE